MCAGACLFFNFLPFKKEKKRACLFFIPCLIVSWFSSCNTCSFFHILNYLTSFSYELNRSVSREISLTQENVLIIEVFFFSGGYIIRPCGASMHPLIQVNVLISYFSLCFAKGHTFLNRKIVGYHGTWCPW